MAILEVRGLVKIYGRRRVVNGVDFEVNLGEIVGLLGPNGAGKTTSFRMTTGQVTPDAGRVDFDGHEVTSMAMYQRARLGMGYLSQEASVFRKLTVEQNILAVLEALPKSRSLGRRLTRSERWDRTDHALQQFGLTHIRKNNAWRCSGGEKRRLEIARCLVCEPKLILLDEPFAGVDPLTKAEIRQIVSKLCKTENIGILLTDHDIHEVLKITDRSYLIKDGKVRTHGTPQQLIRDPIAINEYLGTTFSDDGLGPAPTEGRGLRLMQSAAQETAHTSSAVPPLASPASASQVLEMERLRRLVEWFRSDEQANLAAREFLIRGPSSVPILLEALDRRESEIVLRAWKVIQLLAGGPTPPFDPAAPDALRRQQISQLREFFQPRQAG